MEPHSIFPLLRYDFCSESEDVTGKRVNRKLYILTTHVASCNFPNFGLMKGLKIKIIEKIHFLIKVKKVSRIGLFEKSLIRKVCSLKGTWF